MQFVSTRANSSGSGPPSADHRNKHQQTVGSDFHISQLLSSRGSLMVVSIFYLAFEDCFVRALEFVLGTRIFAGVVLAEVVVDFFTGGIT